MAYLIQHVALLFALSVPFLLVFWVLPLWYICKKAGFSPWLTLLNCIPLGNPVLLYLLAFADWKRHPMFQGEPMPVTHAPAVPQTARPQIVARRMEP